MPDKLSDVYDLMTATPEEVAQTQKKTGHDLKQTEKALAILRKGGKTAYKRAFKTLLPDSREWWEEFVEEEEYPANDEGLKKYPWLYCPLVWYDYL